MSDTPLSDVMAEHAETRTPESYERFLTLFRASVIGIVATGTASQDPQGQLRTDGNFGAGGTTHGDGRRRILAYADPEAALRNFGPRFNAGLSGEVLLQMAAADPECEGILVNSATQEISLIIGKPTVRSLLAPTTTEAPGRRRWWNRR
ncbi:hypothetical protein ACGFI9_30665 [Micromonospora sp. NPDC048930]|uniref:hypothetical protein n=1 Tax=Micromonospora sp. NPDC048930 TaxID=3364261 RepID=UPI00371384C7